MIVESQLHQELNILIKEATQFAEKHEWKVSYLSDIITEFETLENFLREKSKGNTVMTNERAMLICKGLGRLMTDDPIFVHSDIGEKLFDIQHRIRYFLQHTDK